MANSRVAARLRPPAGWLVREEEMRRIGRVAAIGKREGRGPWRIMAAAVPTGERGSMLWGRRSTNALPLTGEIAGVLPERGSQMQVVLVLRGPGWWCGRDGLRSEQQLGVAIDPSSPTSAAPANSETRLYCGNGGITFPSWHHSFGEDVLLFCVGDGIKADAKKERLQ